MASNPSLKSRIQGAFYGLAVCDALGGPVEFQKRGSFPKVTEMLPNSNFGLPPGYFTDDTSMALCLAHSLLENDGKSNPVGQAKKYISWMNHGYMSSTGECFDIGVSTRSALQTWNQLIESELEPINRPSQRASEVEREIAEKIVDIFNRENFCGNGSLMRVIPAALVGKTMNEAIDIAKSSSLTTHPHPRCVDSCVIYTALVYKALEGMSMKDLSEYLSLLLESTKNSLDPVLVERLDRYRNKTDWISRNESAIASTGYVVDSLEASLWSFFTTNSFQEGAIRVVNLGDDADTVGAIYGALAGAYYGIENIPKVWLDKMNKMDLIRDTVAQILERRAVHC